MPSLSLTSKDADFIIIPRKARPGLTLSTEDGKK